MSPRTLQDALATVTGLLGAPALVCVLGLARAINAISACTLIAAPYMATALEPAGERPQSAWALNWKITRSPSPTGSWKLAK